jgi:hypothetical protein
MKTLSVLLTLVLLVAVVAARGSLAQPMPATSAAFQHCIRSEAAPSGRCLPVGVLRAGLADMGVDEMGGQIGGVGGYFDAGQGEQLSNPDLWREIAVAAFNAGLYALVGELARWAGERLFGAAVPAPQRVAIPPALFDPVR